MCVMWVMEVMCVMWVMEVMWGTVAQVEASPSEFRSPSVRCPLAMTQKCWRPGGTVQQWAMSPNQCVNRTVFFFEKKRHLGAMYGGLLNTILRIFFLLGGPV